MTLSEHKKFKLSKNDAKPLVVQSRDFIWPTPFTYGSCKLSGMLYGTLNQGPTIRLRSDGSGEVLATFYSESSDDAWVIKDIHLIDGAGAVVCVIPQHISSPGTVTDRQEITWVGPFTFDPDVFSIVAHVTFEYSC
ncbi:MAG TPA: DUF6294 family protein [Terracidiphilus sp.]|jgi:hypothetical protein